MPNKHRAGWVLIAVLVWGSAALGQNRGMIRVMANLRPSVLFSWSTPADTIFSQGGEQSVSVMITVPAASEAQSFSTHAVVANNPNSTGYELVARLVRPGSVMVDGVELSTTESVIASEAPYGISQTHSVVASGPEAVTIILTCRPR